MPKGDDMQVNVAGLRRNLKNLAHNYSDAQVKVREATSNDPWGPSSTLMAEIADLTYNVMAFTEIMHMIWKRLNDHGKNWRHVYKALVLMEYLIKTGTEKVAMQCKENIFAIETLKDFQHMEDGKDQGINIREKAKQLSILLLDEERLKNERARALKAKERFAQSASGFGSDGGLDTPSSPPFSNLGSRDTRDSRTASGELETARPQTAGEEDLQLQLALAMSREEAERDERRRRSDYVRLQLALSQSQQDFKPEDIDGQTKFERVQGGKAAGDGNQQSHLLDLLDVNLGNPVIPAASTVDPWGAPPTPPQRPQTSADPWSSSTSSPPGGTTSPPLADPWSPRLEPPKPAASLDPWAPLSNSNVNFNQSPPPMNNLSTPSSDLEEFDIIMNRSKPSNGVNNNNSNGATTSPDPFDVSLLGQSLGGPNANTPPQPVKKTPQSFLGENSALVNLDNLIKPTNGTSDNIFGNNTSTLQSSANPFSPEVQHSRPNLFHSQTQPRPSMNEIKQQPVLAMGSAASHDPWAPVPSASPWTPVSKPHSTTPNPFLS